MSTELGRIQAALYRDRAGILAAIMAVTVVAWGYLVHLARSMSDMAALAVFVLMERVAQAGERLGRIAGAVLIAGGALRIITI
jgi:predicted metal-binding membrane protein